MSPLGLLVERNREYEAAEYACRLSSESSAKHQKGLEVQRLSAQTADLHARVTMQSEQAEVAARRQNESDLRMAQMIADFE